MTNMFIDDVDIAGGGGEDDAVPGGDADQGDGAPPGHKNTILHLQHETSTLVQGTGCNNRQNFGTAN